MAYKCLSAFEQVELQKQNERLHLLVLAVSLFFFVIGCLAGALSNRMTVDTVSLWLDQKSAVEQYDFLDSRLDANMRRMIAETWCLQNPSTVRVCHNAVLYSKPVK